MATQFDNILKQYGHDVFLQRRTDLPDGNYSYSETLEIHTVRYSIFTPRNLPNARQEKEEGIVSTSERVYYFKAGVNPYDGDRIYEQEFRPSDKKSIWIVDQVTPMRGLNGEIAYWAVGTTSIRPS